MSYQLSAISYQPSAEVFSSLSSAASFRVTLKAALARR